MSDKPDPNDQLAAYYRDKFGWDPSKLTDAQRQVLTDTVARIENAQGHPYIQGPTGWQLNPDLVRLQQVGIPKSTAKVISLWRHYSAGLKPESVDRDRLLKSGIPADKIDQAEQERAADFEQRAPNAYAMWEREEEQPLAKPQPATQPASASPQQAPQPEPEPEPTPNQVSQANLGGTQWNMSQKTPAGWAPYNGIPGS